MRSTSPTSARFGRFPDESELRPEAVVSEEERQRRAHRRAAVQNLIAQGATAGERDAARAALRRLEHEDGEPVDQELRDFQDEEEAAEWGEL